MDIVEFTNRFLALECQHALFEVTDEGVHWWDAVRQDVFHRIYYHLAGLPGEARHAPPLARRVRSFLARSVLRWMLRLKSRLRHYDVVVFRCPRHLEGGRRIDIALDQLLDLLDGRKLVINTSPHYYHLGRPARRIASAAGAGNVAAVAGILTNEFGPVDGLADYISDCVHRFRDALRRYELLFRALAPKLILAVRNGSEKAMFMAARATGSPIAEAQHGLIHYGHPGYSYSRGVNYAQCGGFPDLFFAFSEYWLGTCYYPARTSTPAGNDRFHVLPLPATSDDVLFISADVYDGVLRPLVRAVAARLPRRRFRYKLHPNQRWMERDIRRELSALPNVEVIGGQVTTRELLQAVAVVVVVQSTVAHEALQAGKTLCIVPVFEYRVHADLLSLPQVALTADVDALSAAIGAARPVLSPPTFFERFDRDSAKRALGKLLQGANS